VIDDAYNSDRNVDQYRRAFSKIIAWETRDWTMPPPLVGLKELLIARLCQIDLTTASIEEIYFYQNSIAMTIVR
jgi:hypothetical protein